MPILLWNGTALQLRVSQATLLCLVSELLAQRHWVPRLPRVAYEFTSDALDSLCRLLARSGVVSKCGRRGGHALYIPVATRNAKLSLGIAGLGLNAIALLTIGSHAMALVIEARRTMRLIGVRINVIIPSTAP